MPDQINNEGYNYSYDQDYIVTLKGFDVKLSKSPLGDEFLHAVIFEQGEQVFENDIPQPLPQEGEVEEIVFQEVAQAAIDLFEAERGTLGQGAGALEMAANINKKGCWIGVEDSHEEWFLNLKGTAYENQAFDLLNKYYEVSGNENLIHKQLSEIAEQEDQIRKELQKLDLQRLKNSDANTKIIIIEGSKKSCLFNIAAEYQEFLDKFYGNPLESEVVKQLNKLIELENKTKSLNSSIESYYKTQCNIEEQMESLSLQALQTNIIKKIPTSGIEAFPALGNELAELMEGVSLDEPQETPDSSFFSLGAANGSPAVQKSLEEVQDIILPEEENGSDAVKKSLEEVLEIINKKGFYSTEEEKTEILQEWEPVEDRVLELGEEVDEENFLKDKEEEKEFEVGDEVELTKKLVIPHVGDGHAMEYPKGEKGIIGVLQDGNYFMVYFNSGCVVRVLKDFLKKV